VQVPSNLFLLLQLTVNSEVFENMLISTTAISWERRLSLLPAAMQKAIVSEIFQLEKVR